MSISVVVDMNLSPLWVNFLNGYGWRTVHWINVGMTNAHDTEIIKWAKANNFIILTQDLDFGTLLAMSHENSPSIITIRTADTLPNTIGIQVVSAIQTYMDELITGAILVVDLKQFRVRILPI